jgi:hypothetical protein
VGPYQHPANSGLHIETYFTNILQELRSVALYSAAVFIGKVVNHCDVMSGLGFHIVTCKVAWFGAQHAPGSLPRTSQKH